MRLGHLKALNRWGMGRSIASRPTRGFVVVSSNSGVRGRALAENDFSAFWVIECLSLSISFSIQFLYWVLENRFVYDDPITNAQSVTWNRVRLCGFYSIATWIGNQLGQAAIDYWKSRGICQRYLLEQIAALLPWCSSIWDERALWSYGAC